MKKLTALLALFMVLVLVGCGNTVKENSAPNQQTEIAQNSDQPTSSDNGTVSQEEHADKQTSVVPPQKITKDQAKDAALQHAGLSEKDIKFLEIELDDDGYYEVSFDADGYEYDYDVGIKSGKILKFEKEPID